MTHLGGARLPQRHRQDGEGGVTWRCEGWRRLGRGVVWKGGGRGYSCLL